MSRWRRGRGHRLRDHRDCGHRVLRLLSSYFSGKPGPTAFIAALGELRKAPALRVATREIAVRVDASVPTEMTVRAWLVPIGPGWTLETGRTKAEVYAPGNTVQYIVPLDPKSDIPVRFSGAGDDRAWTVTLPPPRVDETLVEVQSDPRKMRIAIDRDWVDHVVGDDAAKRGAGSDSSCGRPAGFERNGAV